MACKACHGHLKQIPAVYPTFWCTRCGRLLQGSEEDLEVFEPECRLPSQLFSTKAPIEISDRDVVVEGEP